MVDHPQQLTMETINENTKHIDQLDTLDNTTSITDEA